MAVDAYYTYWVIKKFIKSQKNESRSSFAENLALYFALPVGGFTALIWLIIFYINNGDVRLSGWPSIGGAAMIDAGVITFLGFIFGFLMGQRYSGGIDKLDLKKPKLLFNCVTLSTAYTIISLVLTAIAIYAFNEAFKGIVMPDLSSSIIVGIFSALTVYIVINTSVDLKTTGVVNALILFIVGGTYISMVTTNNPQWWQVNFSSLGATSARSAIPFNVTMILSGFLLLCLADYMLSDLKVIIKGRKSSATYKTRVVNVLFVLISLSLTGVGLFPWNVYPSLHNISAYNLICSFSIIVIGLRWFIPSLSKTFMVNSYVLLGSLFASFALWRPLGYFNQTAFELIAFSLTFTWLVLFLRNISNMKDYSLKSNKLA